MCLEVYKDFYFKKSLSKNWHVELKHLFLNSAKLIFSTFQEFSKFCLSQPSGSRTNILSLNCFCHCSEVFIISFFTLIIIKLNYSNYKNLTKNKLSVRLLSFRSSFRISRFVWFFSSSIGNKDTSIIF